MTKRIYCFGGGTAEGGADKRDLLGGKGAGLAEMSKLGLPVPPGFTITSDVCVAYFDNGRKLPKGLEAEARAAMGEIERIVGSGFGDAENPLMVSVRSGARVSMPGMMDTVLNLGLNDETAVGLAKRTGDERFAFDSYRRFIQMYGDVVLGIGHHHFEDLLECHKDAQGMVLDTELGAANWRELVAAFKKLVESWTDTEFPGSPHEQLWGAIGAVFGSWMNTRAQTYRKLNDIPESWGTAVTVQAMVYGNMGDDCATGVAFTRDPSTGAKEVYGEYLINAQGEDVVAGLRTPRFLTTAARERGRSDEAAMEQAMPDAFTELCDAVNRLESHFCDMQDVEFTVQKGRFYLLQTRAGKRTAGAAVRIATDMAAENLITRAAAVQRIDPDSLDQLLHPGLDPDAPRTPIAHGLPASPGVASGIAVLDSILAEERAAHGESVILVRAETSPDDIHGMHAARGILTSRGGMTSHAAVVARGMGRPCVAGAKEIRIDLGNRSFSTRSETVAEGDTITLDGSTGDVFKGEVPTIEPDPSEAFLLLLSWADEFRRMRVFANADTAGDARTARAFGAEGIGLCRTEHMFLSANRIVAVRAMILAADDASRGAALAKILPMQRDDFIDLFRVMADLPVTIRLLDPPLHEFLPRRAEDLRELADATGEEFQALHDRALRLRESNPMLGHRGCRLGITFPEIYEMQVRAVFEAAVQVGREASKSPVPEIMVPLVSAGGEFLTVKRRIDAVGAAVARETGAKFEYRVGTMIEFPRAALRAGDIARHASFFSFGTNDLTQTTFGISRDDAGAFLDSYLRQGVLTANPFVHLDRSGVGELIGLACERGRAARSDLSLGICGEHGGDPRSIQFCERHRLDYISCSPYRVPIARLAAAHAALAEGTQG